MSNSVKELVLTAVAKTIKGTSYVGIRAYKNKDGEVSNQTLLVGINYENMLVNDFQMLKDKQSLIFDTLAKDKDKKGVPYTFEAVKEAYQSVYDSLEKRLSDPEIQEALRLQGDTTIIRSDAQKDAYKHLAKGVKQHIETKVIYIFGLCERKTILEAIEYKTVNSADSTILKNKVRKICGLRQDKYRTLKFNEGTIKLQGIEL
jgi:hypothetical protein